MAEDDYDDDLFADVYADEPASAPKPAAAAATAAASKPDSDPASSTVAPGGQSDLNTAANDGQISNTAQVGGYGIDHSGGADHQQYDDSGNNGNDQMQEDSHPPVGIKEDGKMFIGGLNWETTDESLRAYFSQFGDVTECTVMRDGASGRSRGFGFLTFRDPKVVNTVMVKEHFLDGKIIDPKRAIPREEQERTAKIFVGGVSPEASEQDFKEFFMQFGRVIDATLMIDKDTGRPRGFGFITFDGDEAVDRALAQPIEIYGKPMEVKRAQPRNALQQNEEKGKFGRGGGGGQFNRGGGSGDGYDQSGGMGMGGGMMGGGGQGGMTPAMMAKYWFNMQQYFKQMQQNMAMGMQNQMGGGGAGGGGGPQMNPMMMAQMMGMGMGGAGGPQGMDPAMMQQMQQMQQMQMQQQSGGGGFGNQQNQGGGQGDDDGSYDPRQRGGNSNFNNNGNNSQEWDGGYDDNGNQQQPPQQPQHHQQQHNNYRGGGGYNQRGGGFRGGRNQNTPPVQNSPPPINAPTGPKGGGGGGGGQFRGGGGYRGGGRGGNRGYHPYSRG